MCTIGEVGYGLVEGLDSGIVATFERGNHTAKGPENDSQADEEVGGGHHGNSGEDNRIVVAQLFKE